MMFELRPAQNSDLEEILALERATENAPHWPSFVYAAILSGAGPSRCLVIARSADTLAGFAVGMVQPGETKTAELESVVVAADQRRGGIGVALCSAVVDWCHQRGANEIVLEVRAASAGAIAFYSELGFRETGLRPRYYREPLDDAVLMVLNRSPQGLELHTFV